MPDLKVTLTAFADEISPDLGSQIAALRRFEIGGLDLRSVGGVNVLDLSKDVLDDIRDRTSGAGLFVNCIGSPVNKCPANRKEMANQTERLKRALAAAKRVGTAKVRIFTPEVEDPREPSSGDFVMDWMVAQLEIAEAEDVVLLHENDGRFWGAFPDNSKRLLNELGGRYFKAVFDFANAVLIGHKAMADWFPWIIPYLDSCHIKDAIFAEKRVVPAGHGDAQIFEALQILSTSGIAPTLTLEPHLQSAGQFGGYSGQELFGQAVDALRAVLARVAEST